MDSGLEKLFEGFEKARSGVPVTISYDSEFNCYTDTKGNVITDLEAYIAKLLKYNTTIIIKD